MVIKEEQWKKARSPMNVTELGIVIFDNEVHQAKAYSPMEMTELGIVMLVIVVQLKKALSSIAVTGYVFVSP